MSEGGLYNRYRVHITIAWQGVRVDVGVEGRNVVVGGSGRLENTASVDRLIVTIGFPYLSKSRDCIYLFVELRNGQDRIVSYVKQVQTPMAYTSLEAVFEHVSVVNVISLSLKVDSPVLLSRTTISECFFASALNPPT